MKTIKTLSIFILALLGLAGIISVFLDGFIPFLFIAFGFLFLYYLVVYLGLTFLYRKDNVFLKYVFIVLFCIPLAWALFNPEGLFEFLLQGVDVNLQ